MTLRFRSSGVCSTLTLLLDDMGFQKERGRDLQDDF
jgi:uncharacterized metal-binding protein